MRLALSAGHRNTNGGNAYEMETTALLTHEMAQQARARGIDVRVVTPEDGLGMHPGSLSAVARQVVVWAQGNPAWVADVYLETHTEGVAAPGVFCIYPDWGEDVDVDVRDTLGPDLAKRVSTASGLAVRGQGVMSEKQTAVGAGGSRLGIFGATELIKATTTRLIVEYGSHAHEQEMLLHRDPVALVGMARGTLDALQAFVGEQPPVDDAPRMFFPETGMHLQGGFLAYWQANGGLRIFGYPISNETGEPVPGREGMTTVQWFERSRMEYWPENPDPDTVLLSRLGATIYQS